MVHSLVPGWSRLGLCRRKEQIPHEEAAPHFLISTLRNARTPCTENPDCLQARLQVGREHLMRARLSGQITLSSLVSLSHLPKPFFSVCSLSASESETGKDAGEKLTLPFVYFWRNILRLRNIWPTYTINGCFEKFKQANKDPLHSHQWKLCQAEVAPVLSHLKQPKRFYSCIYFCTLGAEWEWEDLVITHCWGGSLLFQLTSLHVSPWLSLSCVCVQGGVSSDKHHTYFFPWTQICGNLCGLFEGLTNTTL